MLREVTQNVGRFKTGQKLDYPRNVWNKIAADANMPLEKFTKGIESNTILQSSLKGRPQIHKRDGATQ